MIKNGTSTSLRMGAQLESRLEGLCHLAPELDFLCSLFDENLSFLVDINIYASERGMGILLHIEDNMNVVSHNQFTQWLLDLIEWPADDLNLEIHLEVFIDFFWACSITVNERKFETCSENQDCGEAGFCMPFLGFCGPKQPLGFLCMGGDICLVRWW